jgi:hypothetical protein
LIRVIVTPVPVSLLFLGLLFIERAIALVLFL